MQSLTVSKLSSFRMFRIFLTSAKSQHCTDEWNERYAVSSSFLSLYAYVCVACTAVVTEISYHKEKTIEADVSFLSEKEWRDELEVLLEDLLDDDGTFRRTTDLRSEAGVAWHKVGHGWHKGENVLI